MTTPTVFSDVAVKPAKFMATGVIAQQCSLTVAAGLVVGTNFGLFRFQKGFSLLSLTLDTSDMDTATTLTFDVGYLYDGTSGEDDNAFFDDSAAAQTGAVIMWPTTTGLIPATSFTATGPGYISITTAGETVEVAGTIVGIMTGTYDMI